LSAASDEDALPYARRSVNATDPVRKNWELACIRAIPSSISGGSCDMSGIGGGGAACHPADLVVPICTDAGVSGEVVTEINIYRGCRDAATRSCSSRLRLEHERGACGSATGQLF
jgi:hypothetical protein